MVSAIENSVFPDAEEIPQFSDHVQLRLISQLINYSSRVLPKLLKNFDEITVLWWSF